MAHHRKRDNLLRIIKHIFDSGNTSSILEFGLGSGYSLSNMKKFADIFNMTNQFFGFDGFVGLPRSEGKWEEGWFVFSLEETSKAFEGLTNYKLIPGIFENSLTDDLKINLDLKDAALIHIDCDLYSSSLTALSWTRNLMRPGTWIVFDEWIDGENLAWDEFLIQNPTIKYKTVVPGDEQRILQITSI
jgi:hypothetical protein